MMQIIKLARAGGEKLAIERTRRKKSARKCRVMLGIRAKGKKESTRMIENKVRGTGGSRSEKSQESTEL